MQATALTIRTPQLALVAPKRPALRREHSRSAWSKHPELPAGNAEIFDAEFEEFPTGSAASRYEAALRPSVLFLGRTVNYYV